MINLNSFTNKNEITRKDFDALIKAGNLEVYTQDSLQKYVGSVANMIEKGEEGGELTTEEKDGIEIAKAEIGNLQKVVVVDVFGGQVVKVPLYIQEPMVDIEKGVYHDNSLNRKLGRVGKQWGGKKDEEDPRAHEKDTRGKEGAERVKPTTFEYDKDGKPKEKYWEEEKKPAEKKENIENDAQQRDYINNVWKHSIVSDLKKNPKKYKEVLEHINSLGGEWDKKDVESISKKIKDVDSKKEDNKSDDKKFSSFISDHMDDDNFYDVVKEVAGEPEDDGESESALLDRLAKLPADKQKLMMEKLGNKKDIENMSLSDMRKEGLIDKYKKSYLEDKVPSGNKTLIKDEEDAIKDNTNESFKNWIIGRELHSKIK